MWPIVRVGVGSPTDVELLREARPHPDPIGGLMNQITRLLPIACLGALLTALGCASTQTTRAPSSAKQEPAPVARTAPTADVALSEPSAPVLAPIYFETDQALLRRDARETLKRYADAIQRHPEWGVVTIEGHCDERGSEEYNVALGGRRAAAVMQYLTDLGIPTSRLETRTYGETRPAIVGHDEAAWRQNRRTELQSEAYN